MTEKISPFLEGKYGWNLGESGWNFGMDENLVKFSYMFDRNIDSITSSLPPAVNGQAHFLTVDNRVYFVVEGTYYSSPIPVWFTLYLRSTGQSYQFDGYSLVLIETQEQLSSRINLLEENLSDTETATKGSALIGRATVTINSVSEFPSQPLRTDLTYRLRGYRSTSTIGNGTFVYDPTIPKSSHDGGRYFSPTVPWSTTLSNYLNAVGETDPSGSGCFVRQTVSFSPLDFGAIGDGLADDTASLSKVLGISGKINWLSNTYRFITPISKTFTSSLRWNSDGAVLKYDGTPVGNCITLTFSGAFSHTLDGQLTVDANEKSHTGWVFTTSESGNLQTSPSLYLNRISAVNVRRHTLALAGGAGIQVTGGFYRVLMLRPYVYKVRMSVGAENPGTFGIFGIQVIRSGTGETKYLDIVEPHVEDIQSDDPTYRFDQDGILLFSSITEATEAVHNVWGGLVKNTRNRSVKHQGMNGAVVGLRILKQKTVVDPGNFGVAPSDWDIEAQYSGITIRDVTFRYEGFGSRGVVRWVGNPQASRVASNGVISGIRGEILNTQIFGIVSVTDDSSLGASVSNINVVGASNYIVQHQALGTNPTLSLSGVCAQPVVAGVQEVGVPVGSVQAINVVNTGTSAGTIPLMAAVSSNNQRQLRAVNCQGFTDTANLSSIGGLIADAGLLQLSPSGVGSGAGLALISCGQDKASVAMIAFDSSGTTILQQTAARFVGGNTTEPATGDFRVYVSAGKLTIRNRSGITSRMSIQIIG